METLVSAIMFCITLFLWWLGLMNGLYAGSFLVILGIALAVSYFIEKTKKPGI
jgi:multisubunit Na+/H+ antiporter MnhE subunit